MIDYAKAKLVEKDLDWILANDVSGTETGFGPGDNRGTLVAHNGTFVEIPRAAKEQFAEQLVALLAPTLSTLPGGSLR